MKITYALTQRLALIDELEEKREVGGSQSFETIDFVISTLL
jgi:hypothetical protein